MSRETGGSSRAADPGIRNQTSRSGAGAGIHLTGAVFRYPGLHYRAVGSLTAKKARRGSQHHRSASETVEASGAGSGGFRGSLPTELESAPFEAARPPSLSADPGRGRARG